MERSPTLDLSRWSDVPLGVNRRRWVIVSTGLRQLFRLRFFKLLLAAAWGAGTLIGLAGFVFSQSVATGGWLERFADNIGPRAEAVVSALGAFVLLYPDIVVGGVFTAIFWAHSFIGLWLSLLALTVMVPQLITRDRASNALVMYLSRPLTSADYLLGKLGMIAGLLVVVWTGPLLFGWLLSMAFATNRDFIVHSFEPLLRALAFNGVALVALSAIALGVSALGRQSRVTIVIWVCLCVVLGVMGTPPHSPAWIKRMSFTHNLGEVRAQVLNFDDALTVAGNQLPLLDRDFASELKQAGARASGNDFQGALVALGLFIVGSSFVFTRRLRPE